MGGRTELELLTTKQYCRECEQHENNMLNTHYILSTYHNYIELKLPEYISIHTHTHTHTHIYIYIYIYIIYNIYVFSSYKQFGFLNFYICIYMYKIYFMDQLRFRDVQTVSPKGSSATN